jgi:hypothetical protein
MANISFLKTMFEGGVAKDKIQFHALLYRIQKVWNSGTATTGTALEKPFEAVSARPVRLSKAFLKT